MNNEASEAVKYINPFSYFETATIAAEAKYDMLFVVINLCVFILSIAASYILYQKRDIHSV